MSRNCKQSSHGGNLFEPLESRTMYSAGALDTSFGQGGQETMKFQSGTFTITASDVTVQGDGKTVVVGTDQNGDFAIARSNFDGSADTTFGPAHTGNVFTTIPNDTHNNHATAVAIQGDGKIDVLGYSNGGTPGLIIARYLSNGALDTSFDGDGILTTTLGAKSLVANDMSIDTNGKMVVAGTAVVGTTNDSDMFVARFNSHGSLDTSLNGSGHVFINMGGHAFGQSLAIDQLGTPATNPFYGMIAVVGRAFDISKSRNQMAIARLTAQGNLFNGFGVNGATTCVFDQNDQSVATGVAFQDGGKIVVSGTVDTADSPTQESDLALVRFTPGGQIDASFGTSGKTRTSIQGFDQANDMMVSTDGGLIVGGSSAVSDGSASQFAIVKYTANGVIDPGFGNNGVTLTDFSGSGISNGSVARLASGPGLRFVATGGDRFATAQYLDAGADQDFATGIATTASEAKSQPVTFIVYRNERLPVATRVYFSIGGTATSPSLIGARFKTSDYTLSGMTVNPLNGSSGWVDIAANQTFTLVTLTPIDDTRVEGTETAVFNIQNSPTYEVGTPFNVTVTIKDNDVPISPIVGPIQVTGPIHALVAVAQPGVVAAPAVISAATATASTSTGTDDGLVDARKKRGPKPGGNYLKGL